MKAALLFSFTFVSAVSFAQVTFVNSQLIAEAVVIPNGETQLMNPRISFDGKQISLFVSTIETAKAVCDMIKKDFVGHAAAAIGTNQDRIAFRENGSMAIYKQSAERNGERADTISVVTCK